MWKIDEIVLEMIIYRFFMNYNLPLFSLSSLISFLGRREKKRTDNKNVPKSAYCDSSIFRDPSETYVFI